MTFRDANRQINARRQELEVDGERFPFLCECEDEHCTEVILVSVRHYEAARRTPRRFLVVEGHEPDSRVVERHDGFLIVEKDGVEGRLVEELDG